MNHDLFVVGAVIFTLLAVSGSISGGLFYNLGKNNQFKRLLESYLIKTDDLDGVLPENQNTPFKFGFSQIIKVDPKTKRAWVRGVLKIKYNDLLGVDLSHLRSITAYNSIADGQVLLLNHPGITTVGVLYSNHAKIPPIVALGHVAIIPTNCSIECIFEPPIPVDKPVENLTIEDVKQELHL